MKPSKSSAFKQEHRQKDRVVSNNNKENKRSCIPINERFVIKTLIYTTISYKVYRGIDLFEKKYVIIYVKPVPILLTLGFEIKKLFKKN